MSSRFHNKFHRHNHHTKPSNDPRFPDSSHDPIASPDSPFQGDFVLNGTLSASGGATFGRMVSAQINFTGDVIEACNDAPPVESFQTSDQFLIVHVNGVKRLIRLWMNGAPAL